MEYLKSILDNDRVIIGNIEDKYLSDTLGRLKGSAAALVYPKTTEEVSLIVKYANQKLLPVTARGAGTNLVGSTVPTGKGIIIDLSLMNNIIEIDPNTFTATVEAGIVLQDFQAKLESMGLFYPPDPGEKTATVGGNIATNAGGMRAVKYGVTRDYVRGLEVVLPNGEIMTVGSKNVKDASGLSLKHLFIGAEGTLGIITKCVVKILPKPQKTLSVLVPFGDLETGISNVLEIIKANANPTAIEFVERSVVELGESYTGVKFPCPQAKAYILLTFDGYENEVRSGISRVKDIVYKNGAIDYIVLDDPSYSADIWKVRGGLVKAVEEVSEQEPVDLVVPINRTAEFISYVHKVEGESGVRMVGFGHAGDGNVHLCVVRDGRSDEEWSRDLSSVMTLIYNKAYELGGLTSGEHGIGMSKRKYYFSNTPEINVETMRAIKKALDPNGLFNQHISYTD